MGSIPGSRISPGEGHENPLQYSCLGNPMDKGAWWAKVHGITKRHDLATEQKNTPFQSTKKKFIKNEIDPHNRAVRSQQ